MSTPKQSREHCPPIYKPIGARIRDARTSIGLSQDDLAQIIKTPRPSLTQIELGHQKCAIHELLAIAEALGVEVVDLLPESARGNRQYTICEAAKALDLAEQGPDRQQARCPMLLIDALVMVAQEYGDNRWKIQGPYGRISKIGNPPTYMALDSADRDFIRIGALEQVLAALIERNPLAATDEHWKASSPESEATQS